MIETILLISDDGFSRVKINKGELISYQKKGIEYIHQKENNGWNNSDTEMFPIIGPTLKNNHLVSTKKGKAILDQHGLLREFEYVLLKNDHKSAFFLKEYQKNTFLNNRKFPNKSSEEHVFWPYDFSFEKKFNLTNDFLEVIFEITSEKGMPFMLGYHPAFELSGLENETLIVGSKKLKLKDVFAAGSDALPILNTNKIILKNSNKTALKITTTGFDHFMLWTEVNTMLCIEPITHFPELSTQNYSEENMKISTGKEVFSVCIEIL